MRGDHLFGVGGVYVIKNEFLLENFAAFSVPVAKDRLQIVMLWWE